ncbi:hypothetical protein ACJX0J_036175, partial [Zea mays]
MIAANYFLVFYLFLKILGQLTHLNLEYLWRQNWDIEETTDIFVQFRNYEKLFDYINSNPHLNAEVKFGTLEDYFSTLRDEAEKINYSRIMMGLWDANAHFTARSTVWRPTMWNFLALNHMNDDGRGLGQGVMDNKPMNVIFHLLMDWGRASKSVLHIGDVGQEGNIQAASFVIL